MLRSFDHAGYYETRLILMVVGLAIAGYFALRKRDYRYLIMFASGVFFQAVMEYTLQLRGMRGANYNLSVFGVTLPSALGHIYQGCVEGGILSLMGFWYAALRADRSRGPVRWWPYLAVCVLIVALAIVVGSMAAGQPISSPRPMFARSSIIIITSIITISLLVAGLKDGLKYLAYFYTGLLVYVVLTFEPMHWMGVRYIGVRDANGQMVAATLPWQIGVMLLSHVYEVAGGKLHYFAVPFALGWVQIRGHGQERYTTSKLKSLVQRGWRRRTNPFPSQRQR